MRVAAIYDIQGNLPALEAVLQEIRQAEVDHVVVGGDVIPGSMPRETLTCLLDLDIPVQFIHGNGDREVLAQMAGTDTGAVPEQFREVVRWVVQQLHPEHERLLAIGSERPHTAPPRGLEAEQRSEPRPSWRAGRMFVGSSALRKCSELAAIWR